MIWIIPAALLGMLIGIGAAVVTSKGWLVILFTGQLPPGWHAFLVKAHRYSLQLSAYGYLLTDDYPHYG